LTISIDAEKAFSKIQHHFMIKALDDSSKKKALLFLLSIALVIHGLLFPNEL
jgi:hypothetical protein